MAQDMLLVYQQEVDPAEQAEILDCEDLDQAQRESRPRAGGRWRCAR